VPSGSHNSLCTFYLLVAPAAPLQSRPIPMLLFSISATSPWRWRQHRPVKHLYPTTTLHGITTQKTLTWFITVFTEAHHCTVSWANSIQSTLPHHIYLKSSSILLSHPCLSLPSDLLHWGFLTKILYCPSPSGVLYVPSILSSLIWSP